jgi:predicted HTH domain antitoxin
MNNVLLEIPEEFAMSFGDTLEERSRNIKLELAIEMYREGRWSTGKAAEFAEIYIGKFMELLRVRGVSQCYTHEMLEQDNHHACSHL